MSDAVEHEQQEQRSRIKVVMNAKHDPQWEISVVEGAAEEELERIRLLAVAQHQALSRELIGELRPRG